MEHWERGSVYIAMIHVTCIYTLSLISYPIKTIDPEETLHIFLIKCLSGSLDGSSSKTGPNSVLQNCTVTQHKHKQQNTVKQCVILIFKPP